MGDGVVGREAELGALEAFLDGPAPAVLLLEGEAGIGKTTLWQAGLTRAGEMGQQVLAARPTSAEADFAFAGLGDLVGGVPRELREALPEPQRHALAVALVEAEPQKGRAPNARTIGLALLGLLSALAAVGPVLVGVDDVQWLDEPSLAALLFALRRIGAGPVRGLLAQRSGVEPPVPVEAQIPAERLTRVAVDPLTFGATQQLVRSRVDPSLPRPLIRRLHEASGGNPFFALELAAALRRHGLPTDPAGQLPVPATIGGLLAERLDRLSAPAKRAVLATALLADPTAASVAAVLEDESGVEAAIAEGSLVREGARLRLEHPLVGEVARAQVAGEERRELHLRLAALADDPEERARHLAAGTVPPDEEVAAALAAASVHAAGRGAVLTGGELAEEAFLFTDPADAHLHGERLVAAASLYWDASATRRVYGLLDGRIDGLVSDSLRAQALSLANRSAWFQARDRGDYALDVDSLPAEMPGERAQILTEKAFSVSAGLVESMHEAGVYAQDAVELAERAGGGALLASCLGHLAWIEAMRGHEIDGLLAEAEAAASGEMLPGMDDLDRTRAVRSIWRGDVPAARAALDSLDDRGGSDSGEWATFTYTIHRFELAIRIGDWQAVAGLVDELEAYAAVEVNSRPTALRAQVFLAAARGDLAGAAAARESIPDVRALSWHLWETRRGVGFAALAVGDPHRAVEELRPVAEHLAAVGIANPGVFPVAPDLIEALVAVGQLDEAEGELAELERAAGAQRHPWGLAVAARARGLLLAAREQIREAEEAFAESLDRHSELELPFDEARTLLALGTLRRRARRKVEARRTLEDATERFDALGSPPFAARAHAELSRIGGRGAPATGLTPTEERVAALVAEGLSNKEVAAALVVSISAVEAHLTRIYAKLGIRSRVELARRKAST
ncbi:MAG: hypothetical protein QOE36_414 [Gaiellaceae bacterium]|jgi:DNA-binding CsgD family transcriptional regulator|nr:hypothetical protein [Gaiellaceae bacterium]